MIAILLIQLPIRETRHASPRCRREYPYFPSALFLSHDTLRGAIKSSCVSHLRHYALPRRLRCSGRPKHYKGEQLCMYNPGSWVPVSAGDLGTRVRVRVHPPSVGSGTRIQILRPGCNSTPFRYLDHLVSDDTNTSLVTREAPFWPVSSPVCGARRDLPRDTSIASSSNGCDKYEPKRCDFFVNGTNKTTVGSTGRARL